MVPFICSILTVVFLGLALWKYQKEHNPPPVQDVPIPIASHTPARKYGRPVEKLEDPLIATYLTTFVEKLVHECPTVTLSEVKLMKSDFVGLDKYGTVLNVNLPAFKLATSESDFAAMVLYAAVEQTPDFAEPDDHNLACLYRLGYAVDSYIDVLRGLKAAAPDNHLFVGLTSQRMDKIRELSRHFEARVSANDTVEFETIKTHFNAIAKE
jgi:hypothetical protein